MATVMSATEAREVDEMVEQLRPMLASNWCSEDKLRGVVELKFRAGFRAAQLREVSLASLLEFGMRPGDAHAVCSSDLSAHDAAAPAAGTPTAGATTAAGAPTAGATTAAGPPTAGATTAAAPTRADGIGPWIFAGLAFQGLAMFVGSAALWAIQAQVRGARWHATRYLAEKDPAFRAIVGSVRGLNGAARAGGLLATALLVVAGIVRRGWQRARQTLPRAPSRQQRKQQRVGGEPLVAEDYAHHNAPAAPTGGAGAPRCPPSSSPTPPSE